MALRNKVIEIPNFRTGHPGQSMLKFGRCRESSFLSWITLSEKKKRMNYFLIEVILLKTNPILNVKWAI